MQLKLKPLERKEISITGESFVYIDGLHPIEIQTTSQRAEIPSGSQVRFDKFHSITVQNKGDTDLEATIVICEGEFRKLFEGSTVSAEIINVVDVSGSKVVVSQMPKVDVSGSAVSVSGFVDTSGSTVKVSEMPKVDVSGSAVAVSGAVDTSGSTVKVSQMPKVDVSGSAVAVSGSVDTSGSTVKVSQMPKVDVSGSAVAVSGSVDTSGSTVKVSEMPKVDVSGSAVAVSGSVDVSTAKNFATREFNLAANGSLSIAARANRKRLVVQGYSEADETALCRISHNGASANTGAILPCGGGLMGEVEQFHSAAIKVWNPSDQAISIHVMEEY